MATRYGYQKAQVLESKGWKIKLETEEDCDNLICGDPTVIDPLSGKEYTPYEGEKIQQARDYIDFLDEVREHLTTRMEQYIMAYMPEDTKQLEHFVNWCKTKDMRDLTVPRSQDGKSYLERSKG